jgi:glutamyl-tRNA synthetase
MRHEKSRKSKAKPLFNHTNREILDTSLVISTEETAKRIANGDAYDPF